jgi:formyltetrahydrofolate deformylase
VGEGEEERGWGMGLTSISAMSPKDLTTEGSNVESKVLATAVKWVTEKRVLLNGHKTIVFN